MAIFIQNMVCQICGKPIIEAQEAVMFPPFVANERDPIWMYSDGVFHEQCFLGSPLFNQAERRYDEFVDNLINGQKVCSVCGLIIDDPDDYFAISFLQSEDEGPLYVFNYTCLHRSHLPQWSALPFLTQQIQEKLDKNVWKGKAIEWMLSQMRTALALRNLK